MSQHTMSKTTHRDDIDKEVKNLLKKSASTHIAYNMIEDLKRKYKDEDIVDSIMKRYNEKLHRIKKLAEKIRDRLITKYPDLDIRQTMNKIKTYQAKYHLDDSEMQSIINLIMAKHGLIEEDRRTDYNEMSKALGFVPASYNLTGELNIPKDQKQYVDAIKNMATLAKELHNQVTLQSMMYDESSALLTYINSEFERSKVNVFSFVHPVVAALFMPKFNFVDQHMLFASIAEIVTLKDENLPLQTQPQYELYWNIATDPSEVTCVNKTKPFSDLATRVNVQHTLWKSVLNLRQGKFYIDDLSTFISAIDSCKASVFDAADLAYVKDEGTILRKLFSAFSFRPTIVNTQPINPLQNSLTGAMSNIPLLNSMQTTTIPMISLRLDPFTRDQVNGRTGSANQQNAPNPTSLKDALTQDQVYISHKQILIKKQSVVYSREILVFYIHRRFQEIDISKIRSPYCLISLPNTLSQFEKLNAQSVTIDPSFPLATNTTNSSQTNNDEFELKSIVYVQTSKVANNNGSQDVIYGCGAFVSLDITQKTADEFDRAANMAANQRRMRRVGTGNANYDSEEEEEGDKGGINSLFTGNRLGNNTNEAENAAAANTGNEEQVTKNNEQGGGAGSDEDKVIGRKWIDYQPLNINSSDLSSNTCY
jgi:hypothetical protein